MSGFLPQLGTDLNVAVLLAGVNDVLARRSADEWGADLTAIVGDLADRAEHVVVAGVPPFASFPSLPGMLGRYLAERGNALDEVAQKVCADQPRTTWVSSVDLAPAGPEFFARDRFHPSVAGYVRWAKAIAGHIAL